MDVHYLGNGTSRYWYGDLTTGQYTNNATPMYTPKYDGRTAGFILEEYAYPEYTNFGTMTWVYTQAWGTWGNGYSITKDISQANLTEEEIYNTNAGGMLADPVGSIGTGGHYNIMSYHAGC